MNLIYNIQTYKYLLKKIYSNGYKFCFFEDYNNKDDRKKIFLRHDVDADLFSAFRIAKIEKTLGIKSTYFVMLRSPFYNLMSRNNFDYLKKIVSLGHTIAYHYDDGYTPANIYLEEMIKKECDILNFFLKINIKVISFHQPSERIINGDIKLKNFINTYDNKFFKNVKYFSDSNKRMDIQHFINMIKENRYRQIQLLIHPLWWANKVDMSTNEIWNKAIINNLENSQKQILSTERAFGKKRIFEIIEKNN